MSQMTCATPRKVGTLMPGHTWSFGVRLPDFLANFPGRLSRQAPPEPHDMSARSPLFRPTSAVEGASL